MDEFSSSPSLSSKYGVLNLQNSSRRLDIIFSFFASIMGPEATGAEATGAEATGADANISKDKYVKNGKENAPLL